MSANGDCRRRFFKPLNYAYSNVVLDTQNASWSFVNVPLFVHVSIKISI